MQYGQPELWTCEQVRVWVGVCTQEFDQRPMWHMYQKAKRVWAPKLFDDEVNKEAKVEVRREARPKEAEGR